MNATTVQDILALPEGVPVLCFRGVINTIPKILDGDGQFGHWSFQNLKVSDGTGSIKVVIKDREELDPHWWKGKTIEILCTQKTGGEWIGSKTKDEANKNKPQQKAERVLWVTSAAEINAIQGGAAPAGQPPASQQQAAPRNQQQHAPEPHQPLQDRNHVLDVKQNLMRAANGMLLCLGTATHIANEYKEMYGYEISEDQFQAITSSLFIWLDRNGGCNNLPWRETVKLKAAPAPAPAPQQHREPRPPRQPVTQLPPEDFADDDIPF